LQSKKQTNKQTNKQNIRQKKFCNKFSKDVKNGPHQKIIFKKVKKKKNNKQA